MTLKDELERIELNGRNLNREEVADILELAEHADGVEPWTWAALKRVLVERGQVRDTDAAKEVQRVKIISALGRTPYTPAELISLWLRSKAIRMSFEGVFYDGHHERDDNYILNQINEWCATVGGSQRSPLFSPALVRGAFANFKTDERERRLRSVFQTVAYDPSADRGELDRLARHLTLNDPQAPYPFADMVAATEIALANFIYRTKNHMRGVWRHSCHLMPIFHGPQGSSKTTAVLAFLKPISEVTSWTNFEVFGHDSKEFDLTIMPVMVFDEMAGATKADVNKIKQIMTQDRRTVRQIYQATVSRTLITTFMGVSNKDVSTLIRDETGARRFIQINTAVIDRASLDGFDMTAIWRSVDENAAEPPQYATEETKALIARIIDGQRFKGPVEEWIEVGGCPAQATEYRDLFAQHYHPWALEHAPLDARFTSAQSMKAELKRLIDAGNTALIHTRSKGYDHFRSEIDARAPTSATHQDRVVCLAERAKAR